MDDKLPEVAKPAGELQIDEQDLGQAKPAAETEGAVVPSASPTAPNPEASPSQQPALGHFCRGCGSPLHPQAVVCPRCGVAAQTTNTTLALALDAKSTGVAILLSLLFTGAGHWYVGRVGRGFAFLAAACISGVLVLAIVGFVLLPIVWVWAAIDAHNCAQAYNKSLLAQNGVPGM